MDCYNYQCPFRVNYMPENYIRCECIACPSRCTHEYIFITDQINDELEAYKDAMTGK